MTLGAVADTAVRDSAITPTMQVKVYAPFQIYFDGVATSVSAVNEVGPFDVLPHHRNFLCMLVPCNVVVNTPSGEQETIKVSRALMHVKSDRVVVFIDV
jgi:F0F1-type ATP synthase epsilon subunit